MSTFLRQAWLRFEPARVRDTIDRTRMFFVVALGRAGTTFLADLLDRTEGCAVFHESRGDDDALADAWWRPESAAPFLAGGRERLVAARIESSRCAVYGEVNSYLRYHVAALQERWAPTILHMVRDGRPQVRSVMNRTTFTPADPFTHNLRPRPDDPIAGEWDSLDRFGRACWYWASTNRDLLSHDLPLVRFEDITRSYEAFQTQVADRLDLPLAREIWEEQAGKPKNASRDTSFPKWDAWTDEQKAQFVRICGPVMERLNYEI
ncbi:hypothetical protein ABI59_04825 [Acidobacteria bacterium Mor1]|nr:hypothetical protein ABI59_04825 [Acidobacteria bacterium Mor1]